MRPIYQPKWSLIFPIYQPKWTLTMFYISIKIHLKPALGDEWVAGGGIISTKMDLKYALYTNQNNTEICPIYQPKYSEN